MAEKRVSVRLVAEGCRQVRAELEGIGEAGTRGFGRLSYEMELANARLDSFARTAGIALAAVTLAATAAGVAMIRSGLSNVDAQAKLAQSMRTTVESVQTLTWAGELAVVSMGEIEQATKKLTTRLSEAATGSGSAVGALQRLNLTAAQLHRRGARKGRDTDPGFGGIQLRHRAGQEDQWRQHEHPRPDLGWQHRRREPERHFRHGRHRCGAGPAAIHGTGGGKRVAGGGVVWR